MFEGKYSKLLTILLIVGIVVIVGVIGFLAFNFINNYYINKNSKDEVERFEGEVNNTKNETQNEMLNDVPPTIGAENIILNTNNSSNSNQRMYKGFPMVGTIKIPSINKEYPVLEVASKSAIEVAIAIYDGSGLNEIGNTTIVGHNYRNGTFFSDNKKLKEGDKVYITDNSGSKIEYVIYKTITTSPEDSSYLDRDTDGKREISLLTCTDDTNSRLVIFAKEK